MTISQWRQQGRRLLRALERRSAGGKVIDVMLAPDDESSSAFASMVKRCFGHTPSQSFR